MASSILGVDFGTKRVGLAIATDDSHPRRLVTLTNDEQLLAALRRQIASHGATTVVVGLPRNLDGDDTPQTTLARRFAEHLQQSQPKLAIVMQDEALTSEIAGDRLEAEGVKDIAAVLDQEAAVIILEDYLSEA